jgi:hypothetical protein
MDFKSWEGEINTKFLPNNEQFTEYGLFHLITCRMALVMMYKTKADLSKMFEQGGDAMCELVENMGKAKDFFSHFFEFLEAASARLLVAGASVCQNTPEKCGQRGRQA